MEVQATVRLDGNRKWGRKCKSVKKRHADCHTPVILYTLGCGDRKTVGSRGIVTQVDDLGRERRA